MIQEISSKDLDTIKTLKVGDIVAGINSEFPKSMDCDHNWKSYQGLTEAYSYCTLCDKKEDV
jgi:hypothetical protein